MAERIKSKRVKFPEGKQREFIEKLEQIISIKEIAKLCAKSERTIRDWRREKFLIDARCLKKLCKICKVAFPKNIKLVDKWWYVKIGASAGGRAVMDKYGKLCIDEEYRKKKWHEWWEKEGKYKSSNLNFTSAKPVTKPGLSKNLAEFVGIVLGDGTITKRQITITLHRKDDKIYAKHVTNLIQNLFQVPVGIYKNRDALADNYIISRVELVKFCTNILGLKIGNKTKQQVSVPLWIKNNSDFSISCLKGLVDTDGSIFQHSYMVRGKEYHYKKLSFSNSSLPLIEFVYDILKGLNINARKTRQNKEVRVDSIQDTANYFKIVGSNNPKHLKNYSK